MTTSEYIKSRGLSRSSGYRAINRALHAMGRKLSKGDDLTDADVKAIDERFAKRRAKRWTPHDGVVLRNLKGAWLNYWKGANVAPEDLATIIGSIEILVNREAPRDELASVANRCMELIRGLPESVDANGELVGFPAWVALTYRKFLF